MSQVPHRRQEVVELERLRQDRVGLGEPGMCDVDGARDEHDRDPGPSRVTFADEHVAPLAAEMNVEHDEVDILLLERRPNGCDRLRLEHLVALELEIDAAQESDRRLVVDDKDPGRRMTP